MAIACVERCAYIARRGRSRHAAGVSFSEQTEPAIMSV